MYKPEDSFTVAELIETLKEFPPDALVEIETEDGIEYLHTVRNVGPQTTIMSSISLDLFKFDKDGHLTKSKTEGCKTIELAIEQRLDYLETFIDSNSELELDYDDEKSAWMAMRYVPSDEAAYNLVDEDGDPLAAFDDENIAYETIEDILDEKNISYVGR